MKLKFELPQKVSALVYESVVYGEILYCTPFDIDSAGKFVDGWFIVTKKCLITLVDGKIHRNIPLEKCSEFKTSGLIGSGLLECKIKGRPAVIINYSMSHVPRYKYIERALKELQKDGKSHVRGDETEGHCPKCGRMYDEGIKVCYACVNKINIAKKLWAIVKPYKFVIASAVVMFWIIAAIRTVVPQIYRILVDKYILSQNKEVKSIFILVSITAALQLTSTLIEVFRSRVMVKVGTRLAGDLRELVYSKIQSLSLSYLEKKKPGELMNRVTEDTRRVQNFVQEQFTMGLNEVFSLLVVSIILFATNWRLALFIILPAPLVLIFCRLIWKRIFHMYTVQWKLMDKSNNILQDIISGIRVVKAFGREEREVKRFRAISHSYAELTARNEKAWNTLFPSLGFVMGLGNFLVLYFGGQLVLGEKMLLGELILFTQYASIIYGPLNWLSFFPRWFGEAMSAVERIFEIIEEEPEVKDCKAISWEIEGHVNLQSVTFGYKHYEPVLENISLNIQPGEMIGLVGHSGAGKSTLINLIMRFYDVDEGKILIDNLDIKDISQQALRSQIGVVLQETFLFNGTVLDNIRYAKQDANLEEVIQAAKIANAHDFIMKLPDGYDTMIGEKGNRLSGGEKQRIAIARAIIHNPKILILDEATASVDTETEQQIQEALGRLVKNRTTFAIAHRLSTLKNATRLIVIDKGKLAELGTHEELMRNKGIYYNLVMAQRKMTKTKEVS